MVKDCGACMKCFPDAQTDAMHCSICGEEVVEWTGHKTFRIPTLCLECAEELPFEAN